MEDYRLPYPEEFKTDLHPLLALAFAVSGHLWQRVGDVILSLIGYTSETFKRRWKDLLTSPAKWYDWAKMNVIVVGADWLTKWLQRQILGRSARKR